MCVVTPTGEKLFKVDYVIDCDEARSPGRRALSTAFKEIHERYLSPGTLLI